MPTEFDAMMAMPGNQLQVGTGRGIAQLLIGSAGVAAALRGVRGLADVYAGSHAPPPRLPVRQQYVTVPVPRRDPRQKRAAGPLEAAAGALARLKRADAPPADMLSRGVGHVMNFLGGLKKPDGSNWGPAHEAFWNYSTRIAQEKPWAFPAAVAATAGGAYLGYKGTDQVLDVARHRETDSELDAAKRQYEQALLPKAASAPGPLDVAHEALGAGAGGLEAGYALADALAKHANLLDGTYLNHALQAYLLAAGGLGLGAGVSAYNWARDHSEDKAVGDALRQRRERLFAQGPPPIVAVPEEHDPAPRPPGLAGPLAPPGLKRANTAAAAAATLQRFDRQKQRLAQQTAAMLGTKPEARPARPAEAAPPPLPSVVNPSPR